MYFSISNITLQLKDQILPLLFVSSSVSSRLCILFLVSGADAADWNPNHLPPLTDPSNPRYPVLSLPLPLILTLIPLPIPLAPTQIEFRFVSEREKRQIAVLKEKREMEQSNDQCTLISMRKWVVDHKLCVVGRMLLQIFLNFLCLLVCVIWFPSRIWGFWLSFCLIYFF